ncbi:MAG TPA: YdcF family protein [Albitalea sp.]|nr:YdcF family protein [Albitalea sp.]
MNSLFGLLGIEAWKPLLTALLLPPVPFLLLMLIGARLILPRRGLGWTIILISVAGMWVTTTMGFARVVERFVLSVPPALSSERIAQVRAEAKGRSSHAIVVLGGGVEPFAPEYGVSMLSAYSLERLVFGNWLSRETGVPVAFSGGPGWAQRQNVSEAEVAARIAAQELGRPLKWTEEQSRDTRENAARTIPLLKRAGVTHILLVTHAWHMPRAKRAFDELAAPNGIQVEAAPMGLGSRAEGPALDWLPTTLGTMRTRGALRELLGRGLGA